jgi:hypothetical protein
MQTLQLQALRSDFEPQRRKAQGWGVVKSLAGFGCGPVGLVHTCKVGIKYKKPLGLKLI